MDLPSWVKVEGRLVRTPVRSDMDQQSVTVDQFTTAIASIQKALTNLKHEMGSQQSKQPITQDEVPDDSLSPSLPPPLDQMDHKPHLTYYTASPRSSHLQ